MVGGMRADARLPVALSLAGLVAAAWLYLVVAAHHMDAMATAMPMAGPWSAGEGLAVLAMWAVMMAAMMLPSASPMIFAFAAATRRAAAPGAGARIAAFVGGYLLVWTAFSALATLGQWRLQVAALVSSTGVAVTRLGGGLLLLAGVWQLTPLKRACLSRCQSPLGFLLGEWREGTAGAIVMGARHGLYCVGCCWALMALLFVAGVMNLAWIAILAALVLAEKLVPAERLVSWPAGILLLGWGAWVVARGL